MRGFFDNLFGRKKANTAPESKIPGEITETGSPYQVGDVIAQKFQVCRMIGRGGFGLVYHVRFLETGEDLALKTFKDELATNPATAEAFKKEALVWVNLERHPNILPAIWVDGVRYGRLFHINEDQSLAPEATSTELTGRLCVVMELVQPDSHGRVNLDDHLRGGMLESKQVLTWSLQLCCGMTHARAHGVDSHRDIKPANIMIARDGTAKVSDFGLAVATEGALRAGGPRQVFPQKDGRFAFSLIANGAHAICGTPGYIAPEMYRGDGATVKSDIYSFGLVLWQMVNRSAVLPFRTRWNGDIQEYLRSIFDEQMTGKVPLSNDAMGKVIERCLRPKPSERFSTFEDLRSSLEVIYENSTGRKFEGPVVSSGSVAFWNNKGASLAALRQFDEAIRCYDTALRLDPESYMTWNNKGSALSALGHSELALECFNRSLAIEPSFSMAQRNRSRELLLRSMHRMGE